MLVATGVASDDAKDAAAEATAVDLAIFLAAAGLLATAFFPAAAGLLATFTLTALPLVALWGAFDRSTLLDAFELAALLMSFLAMLMISPLSKTRREPSKRTPAVSTGSHTN